MPKRPKGRLFVGTLLTALCLTAAWMVWNASLRYAAYGTLTGRVIRVPAGQSGNIKFLHVREGMDVSPGQLLVTIENVELQQQAARVRDELLIAQADLDAEVARLKWQSQLRNEESTRAVAEYYELYGELAEEQHKLDELKLKLERAEILQQRGAAPDEQCEAARYAVTGKQAKIEQLARAVSERKKVLEETITDPSQTQLRPLLVKMETLSSELARLRERSARGEIRSPVHGRVVASHFFSGEQVQDSDVLCEVLEVGSLEAVVYLPQQDVPQLAVGENVSLRVAAHGTVLQGTVSRVGEQYIPVPSNLQRHYRTGALALPVYFELFPTASVEKLRLGSEVCLPKHSFPWPGAAPEVPSRLMRSTAPPPKTRITARTGFRLANTVLTEDEP